MVDDQAAAEAPPPALAAATSVKLPPFWSADSEVWFAQVEAQFTTRGITAQKTKFDYVISFLSPEFAMDLHVLLKPPDDHLYDTLKTQLMKCTTASEQRKLQQLISKEELGNRKTTQLLKCMEHLLGNQLGGASIDPFLCELVLLANVRMLLASTDSSMALGRLADMADKVMEVATPTISAHLSFPDCNFYLGEHRSSTPVRRGSPPRFTT